MIDLHCHILPDLDDGPETMEQSLAMAETAIAEGITHVVATPHSSNEYKFHYPRVKQLCDRLQQELGGRLQLATGCDFHLNAENMEALRKNPAHYCINQRDYLLVEFSDFSVPPVMDQTLHELQLMGLRPIITHPERNPILRASPQRLEKWVRLGCFAQVTAGSLTGTFGTNAQENAMKWIEQGFVHFVSTDAHNTNHRPLQLLPAYYAIREHFGEGKAKALFTENPKAVFNGRDLPHVPDITDAPAPKRKRFRFF